MNKAARQRIADMVGELADIAGAKDIDAALMIGQAVCQALNVDWQSIPQLVELSEL